MNRVLEMARFLAVFGLCVLAGCQCSDRDSPVEKRLRPLLGQPMPDGVEPPTTAELVRLAREFYMADVDHYQYTPREFQRMLLNSPELARHKAVQRVLLDNIEPWEALTRRVDRAVSSDYYVTSITAPGELAYGLRVNAPPLPDAPTERYLLVHLSFVVPYYFYYEEHMVEVDGFIERDPILYRITPVFEPVLAVIEREIAAQYRYLRMEPELGLTPVPGIYLNGSPTDGPPTLFDALFTPRRF